ncbi:MAG: tetratricopeptide repeat protein [Gammaproteobacteria bacterium]|nr:MAG: tetratricopeptide repeat protein [Gammaproteobacteria bacterium]
MISPERSTGNNRAGICVLAMLLAVSPDAGTTEAPSPDLSVFEPGVQLALEEGQEQFSEQLASAEDDRARAGAWGRLGMLYQAHHLQGVARRCYLTATELDPDDFRWQYYLGYVLQEQGRYEDAENRYDSALKIDGADPLARLRRGQVRLAQQNLDGAEEDFEAVRVAQPANAAALAGLGQVALRAHRFEDGIRLLEAALRADPRADRLRYPLGMAYRQTGQKERARANLDAYGRTEPAVADPLLADMARLTRSSQLYLEQGYAASRAGRVDAAVEAFRKAVEFNPEDVAALVSLGQGLSLLGQDAAAMEQLERALALDPDHPVAHYRRGVLYESEGNDQAAASDYQAALRADPGYTQAWVRLADALMRLGRYPEAAAAYGRIEVPGEQRALFRYREGIAYLADGRCGEAITALESARVIKNDSGEVFQALARAWSSCPGISEEKRRESVELATALFRARPDEAHAETLAMASAGVGDWQRAVNIQTRLVEQFRLRSDPLLNWQIERLEAFREERPAGSAWPPGHPIYRPEPLGAGP